MGINVPPTTPSGLPVPVADGGTASTTAATARTALGLVIGTDVQAWDANLDLVDQDMSSGASPTLAVTNMTGSAAGIDSDATTHAASDGSDHTFIDQDVTSGSSPTFDGSNITGVGGGATSTVIDLTTAVADAKVSPPSGLVWVNGANLTSAVISGGEMVCVLTTTSTNYQGVTQNGPFAYLRVDNTGPYSLTLTGRIRMGTVKASFDNVMILIAEDSDTPGARVRWVGLRNDQSVGCGRLGATFQTGPAVTAGERDDDGVWFKMRIRANTIEQWQSTDNTGDVTAVDWGNMIDPNTGSAVTTFGGDAVLRLGFAVSATDGLGTFSPVLQYLQIDGGDVL